MKFLYLIFILKDFNKNKKILITKNKNFFVKNMAESNILEVIYNECKNEENKK